MAHLGRAITSDELGIVCRQRIAVCEPALIACIVWLHVGGFEGNHGVLKSSDAQVICAALPGLRGLDIGCFVVFFSLRTVHVARSRPCLP